MMGLTLVCWLCWLLVIWVIWWEFKNQSFYCSEHRALRLGEGFPDVMYCEVNRDLMVSPLVLLVTVSLPDLMSLLVQMT